MIDKQVVKKNLMSTQIETKINTLEKDNHTRIIRLVTINIKITTISLITFMIRIEGIVCSNKKGKQI